MMQAIHMGHRWFALVLSPAWRLASRDRTTHGYRPEEFLPCRGEGLSCLGARRIARRSCAKDARGAVRNALALQTSKEGASLSQDPSKLRLLSVC